MMKSELTAEAAVAALMLWLGTFSTACGAMPLQDAGPAVTQDASSEPPSLVALVLDHFVGTAEGKLLVDPRPLKADAMANAPNPQEIVDDSATTATRTRILKQRGITLTDILHDGRCAFVRGPQMLEDLTRNASDSTRARRQECLARGLFTSIIFGPPERLPPGATPETVPVWRVRVFRMTTSSMHTWDLHFRVDHASPSGWKLIRTWERFGIFS